MRANLMRELTRELTQERFDVTDSGLYFPRQSVGVSGEYFGRVNGGTWEKEGNNLIVAEGLSHILNVALGAKAKATGYYLALFSGAAAPADNWTAANFAQAASELISQTEGYTAATRPQWEPADTSNMAIDNLATVASVTFATAASVNVTGAALLTSSVRGGTTGVLVSASKYAATRTFQDGDTYDIGYRLTLSA